MATVDKKIIELELKIEGANTVKDLKEVISELAPEMNEAEKSAEDYKQAVDLMIVAQEKLTNAMKVGKSQISAQEGSYNALVNKMAALKKVQKAVTDDETRTKLAADINAINNQLKAYDEANGVFVRNVGNYKSALDGFDGTIVKFGDSMRGAMETIEPTKAKFESVQKISSGLASGFAAVQGAAALLGAENEELQKTFLKVQSAMAIAQGVGGFKDFIEGITQFGVAFGVTTKQAEGMAAATTAVATATTADAAATTADTAAKGAQAVATEGATVAQTGLNTAMAANPVGLVVAAIVGLIAVLVWLKDDLFEILGGTEKVTAAWNKFTPVISGVGNVVKQVVAGPFKMLINTLKTIITAVSNMVQGDFKGAFDAIKNGVVDAANIMKDTYNVVGNYQEGYADKSTEIEEKRIRKAAELRDKELNNYIKDNEAKSGSDWKYTEEGKKAYEEYFKNRENMYDKDSDEYRQNQRDIWMYNREYQDRITKKEQDAAKERQDTLKKSLEDAKKYKEKILQEYSSLVDEYLKTDTDKLIDTWEKRRKALTAAKEQGLITEEEYNKKSADLESKIRLEADEKLYDDKLKNYDSFEKSLDNLIKARQTSFKYKVELEGDFKGFFDGIDEEFKKSMGDFDPSSELSTKIAYITATYDTQIAELSQIRQDLAKTYEELAEEYGVEAEITRKASEELYSVLFRETDLGIAKFKDISDLKMQYLENEIAAEQAAMNKRTFLIEQQYLEYESSQKYFFEFENNYLSQMYKRWEAEDEINKARIESLEEMRQKYIEASTDMQLTEDERVKAKAAASKIEQEIEVENANHTIAVNARKLEASQNYVTAVQDSLNAIGDILSTVASAWETSIKAQVDAGEISEEEGERQMENMRGIQSAIAMINALASAVSAYNSMASIPFVGPALGAAAAAAALASGVAQVVAINKVKKGEKGGSSNRYAEAIPTMPEYNPQVVTNITGEQETQNLANAMSGAPIKAYVVESDITSTQQKVANRNKETTF